MSDDQPRDGVETYPAFTTTGLIDQPRVPISGERIVIVVGTDEESGLPIEVSISLEKRPDKSIVVYSIREPLSRPFDQFGPELTVQKAPAVNVGVIRAGYRRRGIRV